MIRKLADKTVGERQVRFVVRNPSVGADGSVLIDPADLERVLWNPATPGSEHEPWPLAGVELVDPPQYARIPQGTLMLWKGEGWAELENERYVHRPGGPPEEPFRVTHSFVHADRIVLHTVDGDVSYRVLESPDKWPAEKDGELGFGGEVRWFYDCELET